MAFAYFILSVSERKDLTVFLLSSIGGTLETQDYVLVLGFMGFLAFLAYLAITNKPQSYVASPSYVQIPPSLVQVPPSLRS